MKNVINLDEKKDSMVEKKNSSDEKKNIFDELENNFTLLHICCQFGFYDLIELLIQNGASKEVLCETNKFPPVFYAVIGNHKKVVDLMLLSEKLKENELKESYRMVLRTSSEYGRKKLLLHSIYKGGQVNKIVKKNNSENENEDIYEESALSISSKKGIIKIVKALIKSSANIELKDHFGPTLLEAIQFARTEIINFLILKNANINAVNIRNNRTPLIMASSSKYYDLYSINKLLLDRGANANKADSENRTPLMFATHNNKIDSVKLLLAYNANVNAKNSSGYSSLDMALENKNEEIYNLLLNKQKEEELKERKN